MAAITPLEKISSRILEIKLELNKVSNVESEQKLFQEKYDLESKIIEMQMPKMDKNIMPISVCYKVKGKVRDRNAPEWNYLKNNYEQVEMTMEQIAQTVQQGYAICCSYFDKIRLQENFKYSELVAIDIDNDLTLEKALASKFIKSYASLIYTTASHTEELNKFRVLFRLEKGVSTQLEYKEIHRWVADMFSSADPHCKDVCRIFFGSIDCQYWLFGKTLTQDILLKLKQRYEANHKSSTNTFKSNITYQDNPDRDYKIAVDILNILPQKIDYDDWFAVICALTNTFGQDIATTLSNQKWNDQDIPYKIGTIKRQDITFASMVHIGQRFGWSFK